MYAVIIAKGLPPEAGSINVISLLGGGFDSHSLFSAENIDKSTIGSSKPLERSSYLHERLKR